MSSSINEEVDKMIWAVSCGADTIMDLSTERESMKRESGLSGIAQSLLGPFPFIKH